MIRRRKEKKNRNGESSTRGKAGNGFFDALALFGQ
jgi:hypothetical protein